LVLRRWRRPFRHGRNPRVPYADLREEEAGADSQTGAKYVATASSNCKRQLTQLMEFHKEDVAVGGVHDMLSRAIIINGKAAERKEYL
jgi:hypothetical protein